MFEMDLKMYYYNSFSDERCVPSLTVLLCWEPPTAFIPSSLFIFLSQLLLLLNTYKYIYNIKVGLIVCALSEAFGFLLTLWYFVCGQ